MGDEKKEDLKAAVREAMKEIIAEMRPMPVASSSGSITEIIIRVGPAGAVQVQGGGGRLGCAGTICYQGVSRPSFDSKTSKLLRSIQEKTAESEDDLVTKLDRKIADQRLAEEIEKYAEELGIKPSEE